MHEENSLSPKAIAIYYDGDSTPYVSAKGDFDIAESIIELAREHNIPLVDNPALVELLSSLDVGEDIPESLYLSMAYIIAMVYELNAELEQVNKTQE